MLWSKKITISMIICALIAFFIKMIFFNNNDYTDGIKDPILYYKEPVSILRSKLSNTMNYKVINIFPRKNPTVYTQGLFFYNYSLYESGGLYNKSSLTHMEWPSQKIIQKINLEEKYFAEGIAASKANNILYQLTYQEKEILLYSFPQLKLKSKIKMPSELREGWGLCPGKEKDEFFATDGSDKIFVLKINKTNNELNVTSYIHVTRNMNPIYRLNELIFDGVFIYCNVYFERAILKINPYNGEVMNIYNMQPLIDYELENGKLTKNRLNGGDVLNGIVYIPEKKSFILTGKMWDYYYEIVFNT
jgi:glutamine cyclotransferase